MIQMLQRVQSGSQLGIVAGSPNGVVDVFEQLGEVSRNAELALEEPGGGGDSSKKWTTS